MYNILVCDDDKDIVEAISIYLTSEGYNVLKAYDGIEALKVAGEEDIHLIILDIMMPGMDGIHVTQELRKDSKIPLILLSAKSEDTDKILGLNIGADDYMTKPFNPLELIARVKSQLRRYTDFGSVKKDKTDSKVLKIRGLEMFEDEKEVYVDGDEVKLTPIEYKILKFFMENPGIVFNTDQIYENVWDSDAVCTDNVIAVHIRHIREKIEINPKEPKYIQVVWGHGYKMISDSKH
ncbi:MAG: response regulator transcription factor [Lachnospiraceae bacterium]|nr:response regulator transcription factor [Lachnospiraceae bacterium]